jgi:5-formyltetrahydrofolate cyclo-ligase
MQPGSKSQWGKMAAGGGAKSALVASKAALRSVLKVALREKPHAAVAEESRAIVKAVLELPEFVEARSVFLFLAMPQETQTWELLGECKARGKAVFVPRTVGRNAMAVLQVEEDDRVEEFEKNAWGIPEPPLPPQLRDLTAGDTDRSDFPWESVEREARSLSGVEGGGRGEEVTPRAAGRGVVPIDVVIVPGVAFDDCGRRLGHGRGYYDTFLQSLDRRYAALGARFPTLVALAFDEQVVPEVPTGDRDWRVDMVVTPTRTIRCRK